jgi:hypothetical protein
MSRKQGPVQRNNRRFRRGLKRKEQFTLRRNTTGTEWIELQKIPKIGNK